MRYIGEFHLSYQMDRGANEDRVWAGRVRLRDGTRAVLACVADGVGGAQHGAEVAEIALQMLRKALREACADIFETQVAASGWARDLAEALQSAVAAQYAGGFCTLCAVVQCGRRRLVLNVGDSGAYWISGDGARRLTDEHTVARWMLQEGHAEEEIPARMFKALHRAVGKKASGGELFDVAIEACNEKRGWVVVASDGVLDNIGGTELRAAGAVSTSASGMARRIMREMLRLGRGRNLDNASLAVLALRPRAATTIKWVAALAVLALIPVFWLLPRGDVKTPDGKPPVEPVSPATHETNDVVWARIQLPKDVAARPRNLKAVGYTKFGRRKELPLKVEWDDNTACPIIIGPEVDNTISMRVVLTLDAKVLTFEGRVVDERGWRLVSIEESSGDGGTSAVVKTEPPRSDGGTKAVEEAAASNKQDYDGTKEGIEGSNPTNGLSAKPKGK